MKHNYLFAIVTAVVVVVLGIYLLGRDGTENESMNLSSSEEENSQQLQINTGEIGTTTEESTIVQNEEPFIEGEVENLPENATTTTEEVSDTGIVTYTDTGFSPKTITIEQGNSVTFINNSSRNMWVASNRHPTHNEYPEESDEDCLGSSFDACSGISVGDSWSFTFDRIGEWGYHDHLNASRTGTVIVE